MLSTTFFEGVGVATTGLLALAGLIKAANYVIRNSSLLANTIWELKKYGLRRIKKNGESSIID